jgi:hypothetical protein
MTRFGVRFHGCFLLNILAAYAASLLPFSDFYREMGWRVIFTPIAFALLGLWATSHAVTFAVLAIFVGALALLAAISCSSKLWWLPAAAVFFVCLLQAIMAATLLAGINAIGHS